ncbi:SRPBCC family protein [Phycicoccus sp. CSK15P-2]|uniref:SRPBCC family protein n=1 Tax=Phycicoccus sp. CSK15P-2 TaxID=2807627 RepID=UPI0019518B69|nr:SRPBCC family protein [Phycicoccus sp. CSK15P-2]MBM6405128.1 SRPBCC family protein [Phycicoccus sp. CSK15P-2]
MAFTVHRSTSLPAPQTWAVVTDLPEHTRHVPLTDVEVAGDLALGTEVRAVTRVGPLAGADRMLVTALEPGRRLRLVKTGWFLRGWADITVEDSPEGSRVEWTEELWLPGLRRVTRPLGDRLGPVLFGRVVDGLVSGAERAAPGRGSAR